MVVRNPPKDKCSARHTHGQHCNYHTNCTHTTVLCIYLLFFHVTGSVIAKVNRHMKFEVSIPKTNKKAVLPQGNRVMLQVFFSVEVRQQHSLQV